MITARKSFTHIQQKMHAGAMKDDCEINPVVKADDGYGVETYKFPHSNMVIKGRLQNVMRIPGTPEAGGTTFIVGNFFIKLPWDVKIEVIPGVPTKQCQIVVNGGSTYQVMNVYRDNVERLTVTCYCYEVH